MPEASISMDVRQPADGAAVIDIDGQITGFAENVLMDAYTQATKRGAKSVLLNFTKLDYMNSSGIGLLVTLLVRTKRKGQRLAAFGLSDHYREIFQLTRLDEAITIHDDEAERTRRSDIMSTSDSSEGGGPGPVDRLHVQGLPTEAINLNVEGRRLVGALQGFGPLWQKTYWARLSGASASPAEVVAEWKRDFPAFWPEGSSLYRALARLEPGDVAVINASQGGMRLSTGVMVMYADNESFAFALPQGHILAGWITFSARDDAGTTVAQVQPVSSVPAIPCTT